MTAVIAIRKRKPHCEACGKHMYQVFHKKEGVQKAVENVFVCPDCKILKRVEVKETRL